MIWRLSGGLAVDCSTLVDLQRRTHGLQLMPDVLVVPPDQRSTLSVADDVQYCRRTDTIRSDKYPGAVQ